MADGLTRGLRACRALASARRSQAELEHARRVRTAAEADRRLKAADAALSEAVTDWDRQMSEGCDPLIGALHGRNLTQRAEVAEIAAAQSSEAATDVTDAGSRWRLHDGRCRQLDARISDLRHRAAKRRDELRLHLLEDRVTFDWIG